MIDSGPSDRVFGLMFAGVFAGIGIVAWVFFGTVLIWAAGISGGFLVVASVAPGVLLPLNRLWGLFAHGVSRVTNFLLLGVFFYGIALPMGLLLRLFGRDPMARRFRPDDDTYFTPVVRHTSAETLEDLF
jgi:hypothetical protein